MLQHLNRFSKPQIVRFLLRYEAKVDTGDVKVKVVKDSGRIRSQTDVDAMNSTTNELNHNSVEQTRFE